MAQVPRCHLEDRPCQNGFLDHLRATFPFAISRWIFADAGKRMDRYFFPASFLVLIPEVIAFPLNQTM